MREVSEISRVRVARRKEPHDPIWRDFLAAQFRARLGRAGSAAFLIVASTQAVLGGWWIHDQWREGLEALARFR